MGKQQGTGRTATACESPLCHGCPGCWTPGYLPYRIHISLPSIIHWSRCRRRCSLHADNCHRPSGSCFLPSTDRRSVHYCTDSKSGPGRRRKWPRTINANGVESPLVPGCSFVDNPCARSASSSRLTVNSVAEGKPPDPVGRPTRLRCSDCPAPTPGVVFQSPPPWFRTRRVLGGGRRAWQAGLMADQELNLFSRRAPKHRLTSTRSLPLTVSRDRSVALRPPGRSIPHTPAFVCVPIRHHPWDQTKKELPNLDGLDAAGLPKPALYPF